MVGQTVMFVLLLGLWLSVVVVVDDVLVVV